jgi:hypothetical protein
MPFQIAATQQITAPTTQVSIAGVVATTVTDAIAEVAAKANASKAELADLEIIDLVVWIENRLT